MPIVHVVDDNFTVRESIGFVLEDAAYLVRDYASAEDFLRSVEADKPGCVIADLHMAPMSGLDLLDRLKHMGVALPTIMITGDDSVENIVLAMRRGAIDFIFKPFTSATLLATVRSALEHVGNCPGASAEAEFCREKLAALVPDEEAVLDAVLQGQSIENIASVLGLFAHDVMVHHANVMTKIGAKNLPDLVRKSLLGGGVFRRLPLPA